MLSAKSSYVDVRALALAAAVTLPFYVPNLLFGLDVSYEISSSSKKLVGSVLNAAGYNTFYAFGTTFILVGMSLLLRSHEPQFDSRRFLMMVAGAAVLLTLLSASVFMVWILSLPDDAFSFEWPAEYLATKAVLSVTAGLISPIVGGWTYIRVRRTRVTRDIARLRALSVIATLAVLWPILDSLRWTVIQLSESRPEYPIALSILSQVAAMIQTVFVGFGEVFVFGLIAIALIPKATAETKLSSILWASLAAGLMSWVVSAAIVWLNESNGFSLLALEFGFPWFESRFFSTLPQTLAFTIIAAPIYWWMLDPQQAKTWVRTNLKAAEKSGLWQPSLRHRSDDSEDAA